MKHLLISLLSTGMIFTNLTFLKAEDSQNETVRAIEATVGEAVADETVAAETGTNATSSVSDASGINVDYHSVAEIRQYVEQNGPQFLQRTYAEEPLLTAPYSSGKLTQTYLEDGLKAINTIRYIAGLNYNVTLDDYYNEIVQTGQMINAVNNVMTHYPARPEGMSDEMYNAGALANRSSNIAAGYSNLCSAVIDGWLEDGDASNIQVIGHRRWLLNAPMAKTGLGHVGKMSGMYAFDRSGSTGKTSNVWPAQNTPVEYFGTQYPWSLSTGTDEDISKVRVALTYANSGTTVEFYQGCENGYFNVDNGGYGAYGAIIWRPANRTYAPGDVYQVKITGLSGGDISYTVNFFELYTEESVLYSDPSELNLYVGETATVRAYFVPGGTSDKVSYVSYSSGNVFDFDFSGGVSELEVTALKPGNGYIIFVSEEGKKATCYITVKQPTVNIYGHSLSLEGEIGVNFYLEIPDILLDKAVIKTEFNGMVEDTAAKDLPVRTIDGSDKRFVSVTTVAKEMRDIIHLSAVDTDEQPVTLIDSSGKDVTDGYSYSVAAYCQSALTSSSQELKTLADAMNTYGKYAQMYFNYKVDDDVKNAGDVSSVTAETVSKYYSFTTGSVKGVSFAGVSLELEAATAVRIYFSFDEGYSPDKFTYKYFSKDLQLFKKENSDLYYVTVDNIAAKNLDAIIDIVVSDGKSTSTMELYALSYVLRALNSTTVKPELQNVSRALYLYNQAANQYFK